MKYRIGPWLLRNPAKSKTQGSQEIQAQGDAPALIPAKRIFYVGCGRRTYDKIHELSA